MQIRNSGITLSTEQNTIIQRTLTHLKDLEDEIEKVLSDGSELKSRKLNRLISEDIDGLVTVLTQLKAQPEGGEL